MSTPNMQSALEAIFFAHGEPVQIGKICNVLDIKYEKAIGLCENLKDTLDKRHSGLKLIKIKDSYQLCTRGEYKNYIEQILELKRNTPLSPAAMEVLAIIAYNEPVTRAFVDQIRGVDCAHVIGSLCLKGLVEERGRLELPGRPLLYGVTDNFLRCFGLESLENLPTVPKDENTDTGQKQGITDSSNENV